MVFERKTRFRKNIVFISYPRGILTDAGGIFAVERRGGGGVNAFPVITYHGYDEHHRWSVAGR